MVEVFERAGNHMIEDETLPKNTGQLLMKKNISIASAESCTGGMFAQRITDISGISQVFDRGIVTYSNEAKMEELGVKQETLKLYGAVSRETAQEMAIGVKMVSGVQIGVSVTGVAGPKGGTVEKPVGLVYVCAASDLEIVCRELRLEGDRSHNRRNAMLNMFELVYMLAEKI